MDGITCGKNTIMTKVLLFKALGHILPQFFKKTMNFLLVFIACLKIFAQNDQVSEKDRDSLTINMIQHYKSFSDA